MWLGGGVEALHVFGRESAGLGERGELGGMEDLVGVGVADSGEDARVGEDALKGVVFRGESVRELFEAEGEDV